jgi:hypothetical protein
MKRQTPASDTKAKRRTPGMGNDKNQPSDATSHLQAKPALVHRLFVTAPESRSPSPYSYQRHAYSPWVVASLSLLIKGRYQPPPATPPSSTA